MAKVGRFPGANDMEKIAMKFAILGKLTARPKIDGKRVTVRKKAHKLRDGRTLCRAENAYKKQPRYTAVENPEPSRICRNCLGLDSEQYAEPLLSVLMGEGVAEESDGSVTTCGNRLGAARPAQLGTSHCWFS